MVIGLCGCGSDYPSKFQQIKVGQSLSEVTTIMGEKPREGKGVGISEAIRVDEDGNQLDEEGNIIDLSTLPKFYHWDDGVQCTIEIEVENDKVIGIKRSGF